MNVLLIILALLVGAGVLAYLRAPLSIATAAAADEQGYAHHRLQFRDILRHGRLRDAKRLRRAGETFQARRHRQRSQTRRAWPHCVGFLSVIGVES